MTKSGSIVEILLQSRGSQLRGAHTAGTTSLLVVDPSPFDQAGGQVYLDGTTYSYVTVTEVPGSDDPTETTGVLELASPLVAAVVDSMPVESWNGSQILDDLVLLVSVGEEGDPPVPVTLLAEQRSNWQAGLGPVDPPVAALLSDDYTQLLDAPGYTPQIDGGSINPETLLPSEPPVESPTPAVYSGNSTAVVIWPPVLDVHTQIDLHVSTSNASAPDATTLLAQDVQPLVGVAKMPDGSALPAATDVYFALVARNVVDGAPASPWVPGRPGKIPPELVTLSVGTLLADQVITLALATSGLQIGNGVWDKDKLNVPGVFNIPFNGDPADITVQLNALTAVVTNLRVLGQNNIFEGGIDLANGVAPPAVRPRAQTSWSHAGASVQATGGFDSRFPVYGLYDDGTNWLHTVGPFGGSVQGFNKTTGAKFLVANMPSNFTPSGGLTKIGTSWYVLGTDINRDNAFYVFRFSSTWAKTGEFLFATRAAADLPRIATDGTSVFIGYHSTAADQLRARQFETTQIVGTANATAAETRTDVLDVAWPGAGEDVRGFYVGTADLGTTRFVVAHTAGIRVYTKAGGADGATQTRVPANDWAVANGEELLGLAWDGTSFYGLSVAGRAWRYSKRTTAETVAIAHSFLDSDIAGGKHETQPGTVLTYTAPARTWTRVDVDPPNDGGGVNDPDSVSIYLANHRQADLAPGVVTALYDKFDLTGAAGQTINGFASLPNSIGEVRSARADINGRIIQLSGDGTGRTGPVKWDANGRLMGTWASMALGTNAAYTTTVPGTRLEVGRVNWRGFLTRTGGFAANTTYTALATLPDGAYPESVFDFTAAGNTAASSVRVRVNTNGTVDIQIGAVAPTFVALGGCPAYLPL